MEWEREDIYDKIIQGGLIGLIIFTPLPKGSVDVQYFSILELIVFGLLVVWCVKIIRGGSKTNRVKNGGRVYWFYTSLYMPIILLILFVIFQLIPLPPKAIKTLSPNAYRLYAELLPYYTNDNSIKTENKNDALFSSQGKVPAPFPFINAPKRWRTLSLYAHNTREYSFKIIAYAGTFFLILQTVRSKAQAKRWVYAIILTGFAVAVLSIIHKYSYNGKALWLWKPVAPNAYPYGPFVNRNHFAGYVNLIIPLWIGMAMYEAGRVSRGAKDRLKGLKSVLLDEEGARVFTFVFASAVMIVSLFLSLSRGGMLSFVGALLLMALMIALRRSIRKRALTVLIVSCVLGLITWFGWDPIIHRLESIKYLVRDPSADMRMLFWSDTVSMFKDYPIYGTGMGTFISAFPIYKSFKDFLWVWYAENDYLQILSEGGIIAAGIAASFSIMFFTKTVKRWKERNDRFVVYSVLGSLVGVVGFLLASIVNFNFHLPANAFLFAVVAGLAFALVNTRSGRQKNSPEPGPIFTPISKKTRFVLCPMMVVLLLILSLQVANIWAAEVYYNKGIEVTKNKSKGPSEGLEFVFLNKAIALNPLNSEYRDVKARQILGDVGKVTTPSAKKWWSEMAMADFKKALSLEPTNGYYWMHLGWAAAFQTGEYGLARSAYENSVKLSPTNFALHKQYALWAFYMAQNLKGASNDLVTATGAAAGERVSDERGKEFLEIGIREYRTAVALNPSLVREALWRYSEFTLDPEKLKEIAPYGSDYSPLIKKIISERAEPQKR